VLRTLAQIARFAGAQQVPLSVCGEMAGHPVEAVLLVGLGFRQLSMAPTAIPRVKAALRAVSAEQARALAERCLELPTCEEIQAAVRSALPAGVPGDESQVPARPGPQ
jgi:signal transduction protein with GAF and PtsI domain